MSRTLTVTDKCSAMVPQPRIVSEDPLAVEIEFTTLSKISMNIEGEAPYELVDIRFEGSLVEVVPRYMNQEVDYIYGAVIIESIRRLSTVIAERTRVNTQLTLLHL